MFYLLLTAVGCLILLSLVICYAIFKLLQQVAPIFESIQVIAKELEETPKQITPIIGSAQTIVKELEETPKLINHILEDSSKITKTTETTVRETKEKLNLAFDKVETIKNQATTLKAGLDFIQKFQKKRK